MKKTIFFLTMAVFGFMIFTGQKSEDIGPRWVNNPAFSEMRPGVYNQLPMGNDNYIPSTQPRYLMSPLGVTAVNPSFRIFPSSVTQNEVIIVCCRTNQGRMFASANTIAGSWINAGDYYTTNSGLNWAGHDSIQNGMWNNQRSDPGPAYDKNGVVLFTHITSTTNFGGVTGIGGEYSTNYGATFSTTYQMDASADDDKNLAGTDDNPGSPYYGYTYAAWCRFTAGNYPAVIYASRTTNGGVSWATPILVNATNAAHFSQGADVCVGPNGYVYIAWAQEQNASPYTGDSIGFARSTNGGVSYTYNNNAFDCLGTRSTSYNGWGFRTNDFPRMDVDKSGGSRNGWIYVVRPQINLAPAGTDGDIVMNRSTDNGVTWSAGIRVNQDALNNGKAQWFPAVRVDEYGGVNVIYYDNRYWANTGDSATIFVSRSIDGGTTWTDIKLSDHNFKPNWSSQIGDYIGITSGNNKIWGIWMDNKAGPCNAWVASIDLGPAIDHTPLTNTEQITGPRTVNCTITPAGSGINPSLTKLNYAKNSTTWTSVNLTHGTGNNWSGDITLSGAGIYNYYITTTDSLSRNATAPAGAPTYYYSFSASADTIRPVIVHTPLTDWPKAQWPATVSASVTDNIGVDSVWVKWYKNTTSTGIKQFKLIFTSGTNYSANFNSVSSDVNINDSIFYRVFARDNSSGHNADSTALYKFKITSVVTITIGTGTSAESYPIDRFYNYMRWQAIYLRSEIGVTGTITKIRFYQSIGTAGVTSGPTTVYFAMIPDSTMVTGNWDVTGHATVYTGTINNLAAPGWLEIVLSTPFYFNMALNQNLLISINRDNQAWISNYPTYNYTTLTVNRSRRNRSDTAIPTSLTQSTYRGNIQMDINTVTGVGNQTIVAIPEKYDLKQNYPNPFNPVTKISFDLPKQGFVSLRIYDVLGREIRTLVNEVKAPGVYNIDFDASTLSSGVYFYKLETNGFSDIKKMMLIK
jgi:hypothetical protein